MKKKIKIRIDDPVTQAIWDTCLKAKAEVDSWPTWKRGSVSKTIKPEIADSVSRQATQED